MISFIVVDYKTIKKTCDYIEHFISKIDNPEQFHFIIVDNFSSSDSINVLESKYDLIERKNIYNKEVSRFKYDLTEICYIYAEDNLGYAKGNNLGTLVSDELYFDDYYIISNNDLKLNSEFKWRKFEDIFKRYKDVGIIGPRIVGLDNRDQSPYKKISPIYHMLFYYWLRFWPINAEADLSVIDYNSYCYRVMGCFFIARADAFRKAGRFDSHTFMYGEEMILSERLLRVGFKNYFYYDYSVIHAHGVTVKKMSSVLQSDQWCYDSCRYYYENYRNCSPLLLGLADLNYGLNKCVIRFKERVKELLRR